MTVLNIYGPLLKLKEAEMSHNYWLLRMMTVISQRRLTGKLMQCYLTFLLIEDYNVTSVWSHKDDILYHLMF